MAQAPHVAHILVAAALAAFVTIPSAGCSRPAPAPRAAAPARVVAIGDVHGDLEATRAALRLAGAIDGADRWIGGAMTVVQTGDQLDRGDQEREILDLFDRLATEARAAGGSFVALNGNHELMNVAGDLRYVTPGGFAQFGGEEARRAAFAPGSELAKRLARRPIYAIAGGAVFAHGGILPEHVDAGLEALDIEARDWMLGKRAELPRALTDQESPVWTRRYGLPDGDDPDACAAARDVMARLGVKHIVVGHTVREGGVTSICDGRVWRIDVGLARHYGGPLQVLELRGDTARVITPR